MLRSNKQPGSFCSTTNCGVDDDYGSECRGGAANGTNDGAVGGGDHNHGVYGGCGDGDDLSTPRREMKSQIPLQRRRGCN